MAPTKDQGQVSAKARADAIAKARSTGKAQPVTDKAGNLIYYLDAQGNMQADPNPPKAKPAPVNPGAGKGELDAGSRASAIRQAKITGRVQPVRDKAGNLLYYVDQQGNNGTDPNGRSIDSVNDAANQANNQWLTDNGYGNGDTTNGPAAVAARQQASQQAAQQAADPRVAQQRQARQMLVGGVLQDPVEDPDPLGLTGYKQDSKTGNLTDGNGQAVDPHGFGAQVYNEQRLATSTFAALTLPQGYNGNDTFLFSKGANGYQNMAVDPTTLGNRMDDRKQAINEVEGKSALDGQQNATNYMTIAQATQWLANLSVGDKNAYNEMVVALNKGGYFSAQSGNMNYVPTSQLPFNTYSRNTGVAFVEAAKDLAVAQKAGYAGDFKQWLTDRSKGYEDYVANGAGYNPVNRAFQDPATLAATAKNAAKNAIGRNLTPAEEARFEAAFHGKENAAYNEMDAYGRAKAVANFTDKAGLPAGTPQGYTMPDTAGEAEQYVNQDPQFAQEKQGYQSLELTKGLIQFLKGGGL